MRSGGVVLSLISGFIDISFLFPRRVRFCDYRPERGEEPSEGECPLPDSDPFQLGNVF